MIKRPLLVITVVLIFGAVYLKYNEAGKIGRLIFPLPLFVSELEKAGGSMERTMAGEVYRIDPYEEGFAILLKTGPREMIRVILKGDLRPEAGEKIRVSGKLRLFREATNPGQFDLRAYYRNLDIHAGLQTEAWEQLEPSRNRLLEAVTRLRFALLSVIEKNSLPEDRGIFKSLILKVSGSYDREETDDLSRYGFLFLVSFSGIHVTCLSAAVYRVLRKLLGKYGAFFGLAVFLFFLCGLSGFSASVKRACLVSGVRGLAPVCRRKFDYLSGASLSLLILIVSLPGIIFTASFQYMAAAASAVGLFYPALRKQLPYRRTKDKGTLFMRRLLEGIFFSLTLQVFLLPVKLWHQFSFSPYALFSGVLSAALLPLLLFSLFPGAAAGLIRPELSSFFFGTGHYIYRGITGLSEGIGRLPWAVFINGRPPAKTVAVYYLFLLLILLVFRIRTEKEKSRETAAGKTAPLSKERNRERRLRGALLILMLAVYGAGVLFLRAERLPGSCLRITHADTGQGDCVIIEADGKVIVSDCGSADMNDPGKDVLVPLLMSRGIDHVDALFLSHGDRDHVNGTASLLKRMPVDTVFLPDLKKLSEEYSTVLPEIEAAGAAVAIVSRG
ncbi:MAG: ComEC/Rec2 family competence protein, partial [Lachnospiraceae bacterium]|nr:ComEC/Rec2 family competence protein [Lachnospiraceae bacterium]